MTPMPRTLPLTSVALAASLLLVACGGGSAGAPDIFPPTVTVTDDADGTAAGPVTFTFTFSEDVGASFTADDVLVTGGTAGALTQVNATQYTMVVTPPSATAGTIQVTVAGSSVRDRVGNLNTVNPTVAQAFDTVPPGASGSTGTCSGPTCVDFGGTGISFSKFGDGGGGTAELANDPRDSGNRVASFVKKPGDADFFGSVLTGAPSAVLATGARTFTLRVLSPSVGVNILLKLEGGPGGATTEAAALTTRANVWETLSFTMPGGAPAGTYSTIVLFPGFGSPVTADRTVYFDELTFPAVATGGAPLTFSSGFTTAGLTLEGGSIGGFGESNLTYRCDTLPGDFRAECGTGVGTGAPTNLFYYHQTTAPNPAFLYAGVFINSPGRTGALSTTADTGGLALTGQTSVKFTLGQNPEWFNAGPTSRNFAVDLTLGKLYDSDPAAAGTQACNIILRKVVAPTAAAATEYTIPLSSFVVAQNCGIAGLTPLAALAASPVSVVSFLAAGGGASVSDGTLSTGANLTVPNGGVYPTTVDAQGAITFQ
jgi:hypothetical protein